jgi:hypothetical protein
MRRSRTGLAACVAAAILAAGWYFGSPWYTLHEMRAAARAQDDARFASYVDFPALRRDLKGKLKERMVAEARRRSGLGALGLAFGAALVGPLVDRTVSPDGIRAAFIARRGQARPAGAPEAPGGSLLLPERPIVRRLAFSEFLVASRERPDSGLVFTRHGLGWKLSGVELPPDRGPGAE